MLTVEDSHTGRTPAHKESRPRSLDELFQCFQPSVNVETTEGFSKGLGEVCGYAIFRHSCIAAFASKQRVACGAIGTVADHPAPENEQGFGGCRLQRAQVEALCAVLPRSGRDASPELRSTETALLIWGRLAQKATGHFKGHAALEAQVTQLQPTSTSELSFTLEAPYIPHKLPENYSKSWEPSNTSAFSSDTFCKRPQRPA